MGVRRRNRRSACRNARATSHARFRRAIERRALRAAEDAARDLPNLPLEAALQLVHLYAERGSPKYERAAMRWLGRYLDEKFSPTLRQFAEVTATLGCEMTLKYRNHPGV